MKAEKHIEVIMESMASANESPEAWQQGTVIVLEEKKDALVDVFADEQWIGKGRLVESQGHLAIQMVEIN